MYNSVFFFLIISSSPPPSPTRKNPGITPLSTRVSAIDVRGGVSDGDLEDTDRSWGRCPHRRVDDDDDTIEYRLAANHDDLLRVGPRLTNVRRRPVAGPRRMRPRGGGVGGLPAVCRSGGRRAEPCRAAACLSVGRSHRVGYFFQIFSNTTAFVGDKKKKIRRRKRNTNRLVPRVKEEASRPEKTEKKFL